MDKADDCPEMSPSDIQIMIIIFDSFFFPTPLFKLFPKLDLQETRRSHIVTYYYDLTLRSSISGRARTSYA